MFLFFNSSMMNFVGCVWFVLCLIVCRLFGFL